MFGYHKLLVHKIILVLGSCTDFHCPHAVFDSVFEHYRFLPHHDKNVSFYQISEFPQLIEFTIDFSVAYR